MAICMYGCISRMDITYDSSIHPVWCIMTGRRFTHIVGCLQIDGNNNLTIAERIMAKSLSYCISFWYRNAFNRNRLNGKVKGVSFRGIV
jgi:hypothetical protein